MLGMQRPLTFLYLLETPSLPRRNSICIGVSLGLAHLLLSALLSYLEISHCQRERSGSFCVKEVVHYKIEMISVLHML